MRRSCVCCNDRDTGGLSVGGYCRYEVQRGGKSKEMQDRRFYRQSNARLRSLLWCVFSCAKQKMYITVDVTFTQPC